MDPESLAKMKGIKVKTTCQKFSKWCTMAKKAKLVEKAYCSRHLKMFPGMVVRFWNSFVWSHFLGQWGPSKQIPFSANCRSKL